MVTARIDELDDLVKELAALAHSSVKTVEQMADDLAIGRYGTVPRFVRSSRDQGMVHLVESVHGALCGWNWVAYGGVPVSRPEGHSISTAVQDMPEICSNCRRKVPRERK